MSFWLPYLAFLLAFRDSRRQGRYDLARRCSGGGSGGSGQSVFFCLLDGRQRTVDNVVDLGLVVAFCEPGKFLPERAKCICSTKYLLLIFYLFIK